MHVYVCAAVAFVCWYISLIYDCVYKFMCQPGFSTRDEMPNKTYQLLCIIPKIDIYT